MFVAKGYMADSMLQRNKVAKMITGVGGQLCAASFMGFRVTIIALLVADLSLSQTLVTVFRKVVEVCG